MSPAPDRRQSAACLRSIRLLGGAAVSPASQAAAMDSLCAARPVSHRRGIDADSV